MKTTFVIAITLLSLGSGAPLWADASGTSASSSNGPPHPGGPGGHDPFIFGVCVGQAVAQAGITLPTVKPGQPPSFDAATDAAFKSAIDTCRNQLGFDLPPPPPRPDSGSGNTDSGSENSGGA